MAAYKAHLEMKDMPKEEIAERMKEMKEMSHEDMKEMMKREKVKYEMERKPKRSRTPKVRAPWTHPVRVLNLELSTVLRRTKKLKDPKASGPCR